MEANQLQFINSVLGIRTEVAAYDERAQMRREAIESAMEELRGQKEAIAAGYDVQLTGPDGKRHQSAFDKRGQEYAIDTHVATRKGRGLSPEDMKRATQAHEIVSSVARKLIEQKDAQGEPLFRDPRELAREFFTPLVREGVMPENFVNDAYSEVQELVNATFASYKDSTKAARKEDQRDRAEEWSKRNGASDGGDQFASGLKYFAGLPTKMLDKIGMNETARRRISIATAFVKAGFAGISAERTLAKLQLAEDGTSTKLEAKFNRFLHPKTEDEFLSDRRAKLQMDQQALAKNGSNDFSEDVFRNLPNSTPGDHLQQYADEDVRRRLELTQLRAAKIDKLESLTDGDKKAVIDALQKQQSVDFKITTATVGGYLPQVKEVIKGLALGGDKLKKLTDVMELAHHEWTNREAARDAAKEIDDALSRKVAEVFGKATGDEMAGSFVKACDFDAIGEAVSRAKADDQTVLQEFAASLAAALLEGLGPTLVQESQRLADNFYRRAPGAEFRKLLSKDPAGAFALLTKAAQGAAEDVLDAAGDEAKETVKQDQLVAALRLAANGIDAALVAAIEREVNSNAAAAFEGLFASGINVKAAVKAASGDSPDVGRVVGLFADGFRNAFRQAAPRQGDSTFAPAGQQMANAFEMAIDIVKLPEQLAADPAIAAGELVQAARSATIDVVRKSSALQSELRDPATLRQIAGKAALPDDGVGLLEELEQGAEELKEYERQLVLIDETGASAAEMKSIETLIEQLKQDKILADMIVSSGNILTGLVSTSMSISGAATENITEVLVVEIAGPLKAAKLIVKFGVAMKRAHDRRKLFETFKKTLSTSKRANSALRSTIQGLLDNKTEQITFRAIEDALTLVQIAAAIVGSVPEPVTMAVGKTMSAIANSSASALKVSEMIYDEVKLAKAWKVTLAAIRNPRERATALAAMRLNPTLGMHSIAWAAMEKQPADPIARMLLSELGLNEQTLAVSGTEEKVRQYLATLLSEDRSMVDTTRLGADWMPREVKLDLRSWSAATLRARREAVPLLGVGGERDILVALKPFEKIDWSALEEDVQSGKVSDVQARRLLEQAAHLTRLLREYEPKAEDGSSHEEMANLAARFLKLAVEQERRLQDICGSMLQTVGEG